MKSIKEYYGAIKKDKLANLSDFELKKRIYGFAYLITSTELMTVALAFAGYNPFFFLATTVLFVISLLSMPAFIISFVLNIYYEKIDNIIDSKPCFIALLTIPFAIIGYAELISLFTIEYKILEDGSHFAAVNIFLIPPLMLLVVIPYGIFIDKKFMKPIRLEMKRRKKEKKARKKTLM